MRIGVLLKGTQKDPHLPDLLWGMGPSERSALALALQLAQPNDHISAYCIGPQNNEEILTTALRYGVHQALRIWEDDLASNFSCDKLSEILASIINKEKCEVIICGERSGDYASGAVGPMTAHYLQVPHLSSVVSFEQAEGTLSGCFLHGKTAYTFQANPPLLITARSGELPPIPKEESLNKIEVTTFSSLGFSREDLNFSPFGEIIPNPNKPHIYQNLSELISTLKITSVG